MVLSKRFVVLLVSAVALLVCLSTMVGGTFATNATTYIKDNGLQFNLIHVETSTILEKDKPHTVFGTSQTWEPGKMVTAQLKVDNKCNFPFEFWIYPHAAVSAETVDIASVLDVYLYKGSYVSTERPVLGNGWTYLGTLRELNTKVTEWNTDGVSSSNSQGAHGNVSAVNTTTAKYGESSETITLLLKMKEEADNQYQGKTANIHISLFANQIISSTNG